ncbi:trypsin-like peptidase domain-containing protein [Streptomyces sp. NPDC046831]|uniref:trypsin-like serine peptidase n=1 Tax=Streptomyces sp. NPDC046831 TaxID=3154805 RepID=UPI0033D78FD2
MKRTSHRRSPARHARRRARSRHGALLGALLLLAATSASVAAADDGPGPLGVTTEAVASAWSARVGVLFAADDAGAPRGDHFCTASVVHSPGRDLVVTAAHCLDGDTDLVFVPGYRDGAAPYGTWEVQRRLVPGRWAEGRDEDSDVAFAVVAHQDGRGVEDAVGGNRFVTGTATGATAVTVTGYPRSRDVPVRCTAEPDALSRTQQRVRCPDFTGGTSGSPWIGGNGELVGVLGGHERGGSTADVSYSVVLGREAAELYEEAAS